MVPIFSSSIFFLAIFEYKISIGCVVSYKLGACSIINAVPNIQANANSQRNKRSNTIATYFQSSSTCEQKRIPFLVGRETDDNFIDFQKQKYIFIPVNKCKNNCCRLLLRQKMKFLFVSSVRVKIFMLCHQVKPTINVKRHLIFIFLFSAFFLFSDKINEFSVHFEFD